MFAQHIINLYLCSQITISNTIKLKKNAYEKDFTLFIRYVCCLCNSIR